MVVLNVEMAPTKRQMEEREKRVLRRRRRKRERE